MRPRIMPVVALALVAVALLGGVAYGDTAADNAQCLSCHGPEGTGAVSKVDFGVGPVDKASACNKCHWITNHPYHFQESQCGGTCHKAWYKTPRTEFFKSVVSTEYGYFSTAESVSASPERLHEIHTKRTWIAEANEYAPACANCHAAASCDACHAGTLAHGVHGVLGDSTVGAPTVPVRTSTAAGVLPNTYDLTGRTVDSDSACAAVECHAAPEEHERVFTGDSRVTRVGAWTSVSSSQYFGGEQITTTEAGAYLEMRFTGTGFSWIGTRQLSGGIADVYVDGELVATVDTYGTPWGAVRTVYWVGDLTDGEHVLRIVNSGTKNSAATGIKVAVQGFDVRTTREFIPTPGCTGCHVSFDDHYDETAHSSTTVSCSGDGCHAVTSGLLAVHEERNAAFGCLGCHSSIRTAVQDAIAAGDTSCGGCHGTISGLGGHRDAHAAVPPLVNDTGAPLYSYYTGSRGTAPTRDCVGCHTSNLVDEHMGLYYGGLVIAPRFDNTGAPFTCGTCHDQPQGSAIQDAIGAGQSACESCHPVHGPISALHTSTFVDSPEVPCADCHSANLAEEHNGQYTSGAGLTGCDVCHDLYDGLTSGDVTGADTMAAIDVANDTRCSACHTSYHTDSAAHDASAAASIECGSCHAPGDAVIDVTAIHSTCATCHASQRIGEISEHTAECASCHSTEGTDYHSAMTAGHTYTAMDESCASCHANTLPEVHAEFLSRYPAYDSTCDLCHKNADPSRIDWATASADCSSCHEIHGDIAVVHTATSSQACVDCHESADVRTLHAATPDASCDVCHNAPAGRIDWATATVECTSCHGMLAPVDPKHYPAQAHSATTETGCTLCHSVDVKTEHFKSTVAVSCVACHELKVDTFTAPWDKTCTACHPTKHANQAIAHKSTNTACTGTGCHVVTDVSVLHGTNCAACHAVGVTASTNCTLCHSGSNPHHVTITLMATTDSGWKTMCGSCHGRTHSMSGCSRCHSVSKLHSESRHVDRNSQCAGCHKIAAADASDDCLRCHTSLSSGSGGGSWGGGSWGGGSWGGR